jgi:hypothetical protein
MYIVWGSKLMGRCDVVPGLFHVETKFGHIYYLPLIPTASWLVLSKSGKGFRGVPIPLSVKSILLAWARAAFFLAGLIFALIALMMALDKHAENWLLPALGAAAAWGVGAVISYLPLFTRASANRAYQLAQKVGVNQQGYAMIQKIYGQAPPRGFEVRPLPATTAAAPPSRLAAAATAAPRAVRRSSPQMLDSAAIPLEE